MGVIDRVRKANAPRAPEESRVARAGVLACVASATIAAAVVGAVPFDEAAIALPLLLAGGWMSWKRRSARNGWLKLVLALAALAALANFLLDMRTVRTADEARYPLAELFLWVQVIHGFDVPARRDLYFSVVAATGLAAVAASVSQDYRFAGPLALFAACGAFALWALDRAALAARTSDASFVAARSRSARRSRAASLRGPATTLCALIVVAGIVSLVLPRSGGVRGLTMPFELGLSTAAPGDGSIGNPGADGGGRAGGGAYFGVSDEMDLRVRGDLGDQLVMRVRSAQPAMWKGASFDSYDGVRWRTTAAPGMGLPPGQSFLPGSMPIGKRRSLIQTFFIETDGPSVLFAADEAAEVHSPVPVRQDAAGTLRTTAALGEGSVYSTVSYLPAASPEELVATSGEPLPADVRRLYLQVPRTLPARVPRLARRITAGKRSAYAKVKAVENHLRRNYRYTIDSAVPPPGRDAVDHFLFDERQGFCEQFASAAAVMLRSVGVPTRLVAGYAPGDHNFLSGYREIRARDGHAWIEAYFPGQGWYPFDPTLDVPPAQTGAQAMFPGLKIVAGALTAALGAIAQAARSAGGVPALSLLGALGAIAVALAVTAVLRRVRRRRRHADPVLRSFERMTAALARRDLGLGRPPGVTVAEWGDRAAGRLGGDASGEELAKDVRSLVATVERAAYSDEKPDERSARLAIETCRRLRRSARPARRR